MSLSSAFDHCLPGGVNVPVLSDPGKPEDPDWADQMMVIPAGAVPSRGTDRVGWIPNGRDHVYANSWSVPRWRVVLWAWFEPYMLKRANRRPNVRVAAQLEADPALRRAFLSVAMTSFHTRSRVYDFLSSLQ